MATARRTGPQHLRARRHLAVLPLRLSPPRRVTSKVVALVLAVVVAGLAVTAVVELTAGGWRAEAVSSSSMRPGIPDGGLAFAERVPVSSLRPRDVLVFERPGHPGVTEIRRIVSLTHKKAGTEVRTRGDADRALDPWTVKLRGGGHAYQVRFAVPLAGYVWDWFVSRAGRLEIGAAGLLLAGALAWLGATELRRRTRARTATVVAPPTAEVEARRGA